LLMSGALNMMTVMNFALRAPVVMMMLCACREGRERQNKNKKELFHNNVHIIVAGAKVQKIFETGKL